MDPGNQQRVWDLIQTYKQDRLFVVTTHLMEEADILGMEARSLNRSCILTVRRCATPVRLLIHLLVVAALL
jgi:hypothetical protein